MDSNTAPSPTYRVLADYEVTDHCPLILNEGSGVEVVRADPSWPGWLWIRAGDQSGWIPETFLADPGETKTVTTRAFNGSDLSAKRGEVLSVEESANGWILAINQSEKTGWFPLFNLRPVPQT